MLHLGSPVGRAGPIDASIAGAIYKDVWVGAGPRPIFAVAGELIADRPRLKIAALSVSGVGLVMLTSLFARGSYLS